MSGSDADDLVVLRGGVAVPLPVLHLVWSLEDRGCHLALEDDDVVRVGPAELLTDDDRVRIRQWKTHLVEVIRYVDEERWRPV